MATAPVAFAGDDITADLAVPPAWTSMSALLANSWANEGSSYVTAQYRLWQLLNQVEIIGVIAGGTITDGTTIATLPAGYRPSTLQFVPVTVTTTSGSHSGTDPRLYCDTSGDLQCYALPSGTTVISFHGWISLDA